MLGQTYHTSFSILGRFDVSSAESVLAILSPILPGPVIVVAGAFVV